MKLHLELLVGVLCGQEFGKIFFLILESGILPRLFLDPPLDDVKVCDGATVRIGIILLAVALQRRDDVDQKGVVTAFVVAKHEPDLTVLIFQAVVGQLDLLLISVVGNVVNLGSVLHDENHSPVGSGLERRLVARLLLVLGEDSQVEQVRMDQERLQTRDNAQFKTQSSALGVRGQRDGTYRNWKKINVSFC